MSADGLVAEVRDEKGEEKDEEDDEEASRAELYWAVDSGALNLKAGLGSGHLLLERWRSEVEIVRSLLNFEEEEEELRGFGRRRSSQGGCRCLVAGKELSARLGDLVLHPWLGAVTTCPGDRKPIKPKAELLFLRSSYYKR